ncbi:MAG TPA: filamentous hemagglutinin N-terminal domain-containing protein, partial [Burkholderiales bacterium]|nr:filamentous hemagglutinin N-terminal domain-containing protein [Burkholderiales bacterium]
MKQKRQRVPKAAEFKQRLLCVAVASAFGGAAYANPTGPQVANGQASFATMGNTLSVTNSPNAIINWQSFSIGASETTRFLQQSASSAVLNRVTGIDPSIILGALQSNGKVFLINPSGVLFGKGSRIDVAGLVASTLDMSNQDFLAGRLNFATGSISAGAVTNRGTITTPSGGSVILVAPQVENSGIINAPNGDVILAAGSSVRLGDTGAPNVLVEIQAPDNQVVNVGEIVVGGGSASIYAGLISQQGVVRADSVSINTAGR